MGGINIKNLSSTLNDFTIGNIDSNKFLLDIVNAGYYINHTIYMLIFMAMCIGKSINSKIINNVDNFNIIGDEIFKQLNDDSGGLKPLFVINNYNQILLNF